MDFVVSKTVPDFMAQKMFGEDQLCFKELYDVKLGVINEHVYSVIVSLFLHYSKYF
jgi:hypothetical protein